MNEFAFLSIYLLVFISTVSISILCYSSTIIDPIDQFYIYVGILSYFGILLGIFSKNHTLIKTLHWEYTLYIITAPFFVKTYIGKIIYTYMIIFQTSLLYHFNKCIISYIKFHPSDPDNTILPKVLPNEFYIGVQFLFLVYMWLK